ncbi:MAG: hypothetical protein ACRC57_02220 [Sarcina sp.]
MDKYKIYKENKPLEIFLLISSVISIVLSFSFINDRNIGQILMGFFNIKVNITLVSLALATITFFMSHKLNPESHFVKGSKLLSLICIITIVLLSITTTISNM